MPTREEQGRKNLSTQDLPDAVGVDFEEHAAVPSVEEVPDGRLEAGRRPVRAAHPRVVVRLAAEEHRFFALNSLSKCRSLLSCQDSKTRADPPNWSLSSSRYRVRPEG